MNKLGTIIILAATANLVTFLLYHYATGRTGNGSDSSFYISLIIIVLWLTTFLIALDQAKRKNLFSAKLCMWAILIIQFCTPFPMLCMYAVLSPQAVTTSSSVGNSKANIEKHQIPFENQYVAYKIPAADKGNYP